MATIVGLNIKAINHPTILRVACEISLFSIVDGVNNSLALTLGKGGDNVSLEESGEIIEEYLRAIPQTPIELMCWGTYEAVVLRSQSEEFIERGFVPPGFSHYLISDNVQLIDLKAIWEEQFQEKADSLESALHSLDLTLPVVDGPDSLFKACRIYMVANYLKQMNWLVSQPGYEPPIRNMKAPRFRSTKKWDDLLLENIIQ